MEQGDTLEGRYGGQRGPIFLLVLQTGILTVLTLGIYRFWAKSRVRRYVWNAVQPGGDPMEYSGTGVEKFVGFLIALVVLAVYLGLLQVLLTFSGLSLLDLVPDEGASEAQIFASIGATYATLIAIVPLIFIAQYRGRRYMLSRTRWRGLRFGMDQASLGYMWRAIVYSVITVVSLGILAPLGTFQLEKFKTDRTWYGDAQFEQGGRWTMLYRAASVLLLGLGVSIVGGVVSASGSEGLGITVMVVGAVLIVIGFVHYRLQSFAIMARHKTLDDGAIEFEALPQTGRVVGHYIKGSLLTMLVTIAAAIPAGVIFFMASQIGAAGGFGGAQIFSTIIAVLSYVVALVMGGASTMAFITQPIFGHIVETCAVRYPEHFDTIQQRAADDMPDAEGFADALDVGGAF